MRVPLSGFAACMVFVNHTITVTLPAHVGPQLETVASKAQPAESKPKPRAAPNSKNEDRSGSCGHFVEFASWAKKDRYCMESWYLRKPSVRSGRVWLNPKPKSQERLKNNRYILPRVIRYVLQSQSQKLIQVLLPSTLVRV